MTADDLIRELRARFEAGRIKQVDVATALDISADKVNKMLAGTRRLQVGEADALRELLGDHSDSTLVPDLPPQGTDADYVAVDVVPSYAGAGGGGSGEGDRVVARLSRRLIEEELRGTPDDFELIDIRGDSAEPDFYHGDQILIDKRDRNPRQPGPFVIWDEDGYVLKLVERVPGKRGWFKIFSANTRYSSYEIEESEATIRGRPVWFSRRL